MDKTTELEQIGKRLLELLGRDPDNDAGVADTPRRWAKMWTSFIEYDAGKVDTVFESQGTDQMVVVSGMRVWSMCEHHLMPFWCDVSIGYIADGSVIGLSKLARIAHKHAHALQLQERLVEGIAAEVRAATGSDHVAVMAQGEHLCMVMRGIRTPGIMTSSSLHGGFKADAQARNEFLQLVRMAKR